MQISIFKNFTQIISNVSVDQILNEIKTGTYKDKVEKLQLLYKQGEKQLFADQKKSLPAFTPSGTFKNGRKKQLLEKYSGLIILDLDHLDDETEVVKKQVISSPFTYSCFKSPSNHGLKILVRVDSSVEDHYNAFNKVKDYYKQLLGVTIDKSGSDVTRLCFISYDPDLYMNENADVFKLEKMAQEQSESNQLEINMENIKEQVEFIIAQVEEKRIDITSNYEDWCYVGFALENEFGENGRSYFHYLSRLNPNYNYDNCDRQYSKCLKSSNSGISIRSLFHIAKKYGVDISGKSGIKIKDSKTCKSIDKNKSATDNTRAKKLKTTNKFIITEEYLSERYIIRQNMISHKFEYKDKDSIEFMELNDNDLYVKLQKDNITISHTNLIALLKSQFVPEYNPFVDYFNNLPEWDGETDYIKKLSSYLESPDRERLDHHFKKWLVRLVRTALDRNYYNKQAFVLVSNKQNSGKSTYCRFICPPALNGYIAENIGTDKDGLIALSENLVINLDELSTADKNGINALKSLFSKDTVKVRLPYDMRSSSIARTVSFLGSTDKWEFLTDENGSVRWLCFEVTSIDWSYSKEINMDNVYSQAYHLLKNTSFKYELSAKEIEENDRHNRKYQVSTPERDLIQTYLEPSNSDSGEFMNSTDIIAYLMKYSTIKLNPNTVGKEMKFLGYNRVSKRTNGLPRWGYYVERIAENAD
jgi:hypothetical protein